MSGWHRPDVETAALEYLTRVIGDEQGARQILSGLHARAVLAGRIQGLREAAALVDTGDDCGCGGCDTCIRRALAAGIRDRAAYLTGAGS